MCGVIHSGFRPIQVVVVVVRVTDVRDVRDVLMKAGTLSSMKATRSVRLTLCHRRYRYWQVQIDLHLHTYVPVEEVIPDNHLGEPSLCTDIVGIIKLLLV